MRREALERAIAQGDRVLEVRMRCNIVGEGIFSDPDPDLESQLALAREGFAFAEEVGDERCSPSMPAISA